MNNNDITNKAGLDISEFKAECSDIVAKIEDLLINLLPENNTNNINQLFRYFHNIKGISGFMSWPKLKSIAANSESVLDIHRKKNVVLGSVAQQILKQAVELIKTCVDDDLELQDESLKLFKGTTEEYLLNFDNPDKKLESNKTTNIISIIESNNDSFTIIKLLLNYCDKELKRLKEGHIISQDLIKLTEVFREIVYISEKENNPFLYKVSHCLYFFVQSFAKNNQLFDQALINQALECVDIINSLLFIKDKQLSDSLIANNVADIDTFINKVKTLIGQQQKAIFQRAENLDSFNFRIDVDFMLKIMQEIEDLDQLTNTYENKSINDDANFTKIKESVTAIKGLMRKATRIPLKQLFFRFGRIVKNAAELVDKEINFYMSGEDIEIDKNYLESLNTIVIHILRNSCDHGIESTTERLLAGKSKAGQITINPSITNNKFIIEVKDDGRGLDRNKIGKKLIDMKWFTPEKVKALSDQQIFAEILKPGFSTSDAVSDISGRGVGMDIVNKEVKKLNGEVVIDSEKGKGLSIKIIIPYKLNKALV